MSGALISCIVPVYNGERFLAETVDSILDQTYRPIELIVVDDGSTDGTPDVIAACQAKAGEDVLRSIRQENAGPVLARNAGIEAGRGEMVSFLDADDLWEPEKLALQAEFLNAHPDIDAVFSHIQNYWMPELSREAARFQGHRIAAPLPGYVPGTVLARATALEVVGPFNPSLKHGEMQEWVLRSRERGLKLHMMPQVLTRRRLHGGNRSRALRDESSADFLTMLKANLDRRRRDG